MIINFVPSDFNGSFHPNDCALTHALKRAFNAKYVCIGLLTAGVDNTDYCITDAMLNGELLSEKGFYAVNYNLIKKSIKSGTFKSASVVISPMYIY